MGIPKFFKWITNKYDLIINEVKNIDNLYLDANCLIHPCCRKIVNNNKHLVKNHNNLYQNNINNIKNDVNLYSKLEIKMFEEIIEYIVKLYKFSKPKNILYVSIDGVAPRAKMEQQRIRRYRTYKEKQIVDSIYIKYNQDIESYWDTNAITPGTTFMLKLSNYLQKNLIQIKEQNNNITIILSDSSVPGEGEHKIIQHIRNSENNTSCIYGLDADLIMLSLCVENDIYLLRESINFGKIDMDTLLYFSIIEFKIKLKEEIINKLSIDLEEIDIEKNIIIDYVVLCFLLGNDVLPKLINLDINENSIENLINIYTKLISIRKHNLVVNNKIQYNFLQQILNNLYNTEDIELQKLQKKFNNRKIFRKNNYQNNMERELDMIKYYPIINKKKTFNLGEKNWRDMYYKYYFNIINIIKNTKYIETICETYIEGIQWNLEYYINSYCSWNWYYPYKVSPCLREICQYLNDRVYSKTFTISEPYTPLQQLFLVIPRSSKELLPDNYKNIIDDMELIRFYPYDFKLDTFNHFWFHESIPIIPILDDSLILNKLSTVKLQNIDTIKNKINYNCIYIHKPKNNINLTIN